MKVIKSILITLIAVLLTGCYTQLQYSHSMKKITDKPKEEAKQYTRDRDDKQSSKTPKAGQQGESSRDEYTDHTGEENYVPLYYKDYEYAEKYDDCKCSPYNVYNFYKSSYDWYGYNYYRPYHSFRSYLTISPFYFNRWQYRYRYFGHRYSHPGFAFSISWGHPFYSFYDPFYDPYYAFGSHHYPISYNYFYFSGSSYSGNSGKVVTNRNTRYGPRSIGADRVVSNGDRTRDSRASGRDAARVSESAVRTRSAGTTRTRNVDRKKGSDSTVTRNRSRDSSGQGTTRSRSRDNIQQDQDRDRVYIDRTDSPQRPVVIDRERTRTIRPRTVNSNDNSMRRSLDDDSSNRFRRVDLDKNIEQQRSRPTFFHRMKSFFKNNSSGFINNNDWGRSGRSKVSKGRSSSSNRSSVGRSSSDNGGSSVTRSRSSSSNSRSGGSSSRSRSGDEDSSGGSDRSRGNN